MGSISANKLGGLALMFAPVITLILYFLQPGGAFIDAANPASAQESIVALISNAGLGKVVSVLIPLGLLTFVYGIFVLQNNIRSNGNGDALSRLGALLLLVGVIGWVTGSSVSLAIAGAAEHGAAAVIGAYSALYGVTVAIGTISGILWGIGILLFALAMSTRDDSNKIVNLVAAVAAIVAVVVVIIGGLDTSQLQNMQTIVGITYIVHVVWLFLLGMKLMKAE